MEDNATPRGTRPAMSDYHSSYEWQEVRKRFVDFHSRRTGKPVCANPFGLHSNAGMVGSRGRIVIASAIHHIVPVDIDYSLRNKPSNLVALCGRCHEFAHSLLKSNRTVYREAFNLPATISLTVKQAKKEPQPFFMHRECKRLSNGEWLCGRTGRIRAIRCPVCSRADEATTGVADRE